MYLIPSNREDDAQEGKGVGIATAHGDLPSVSLFEELFGVRVPAGKQASPGPEKLSVGRGLRQIALYEDLFWGCIYAPQNILWACLGGASSRWRAKADILPKHGVGPSIRKESVGGPCLARSCSISFSRRTLS
ncbi:hypothetical protein TWF481_002320 [Arthrobotrys musiformis]|uniref:Uncharacterized protein n=1 Tax=Arthrobotrys musiformis TaxID=47236 RepID=A0AAV9VSW0_9PEZI